MLKRIQHEQEADFICNKLKEYTLNQWPRKESAPKEIGPYYPFSENISVAEGYVLYNSRLVIPPTLQREILNRIHEGHLGISKCRDRAKQSVWWIGLSSQIKDIVDNCPKPPEWVPTL